MYMRLPMVWRQWDLPSKIRHCCPWGNRQHTNLIGFSQRSYVMHDCKSHGSLSSYRNGALSRWQKWGDVALGPMDFWKGMVSVSGWSVDTSDLNSSAGVGSSSDFYSIWRILWTLAGKLIACFSVPFPLMSCVIQLWSSCTGQVSVNLLFLCIDNYILFNFSFYHWLCHSASSDSYRTDCGKCHPAILLHIPSYVMAWLQWWSPMPWHYDCHTFTGWFKDASLFLRFSFPPSSLPPFYIHSFCYNRTTEGSLPQPKTYLFHTGTFRSSVLLWY
jgi:hypothetical protein